MMSRPCHTSGAPRSPRNSARVPSTAQENGFQSATPCNQPGANVSGSRMPESSSTGWATVFINGLQLVKSLSGKEDSSFSGDKSYEQLVNTVLGVSAMINGSQQAVQTRRNALEQAGAQIGTVQDIKGSIDQNTQLQVQSGLTLNEMIGVMNGAVSSLQADNQRRLTDISNSKKALA